MSRTSPGCLDIAWRAMTDAFSLHASLRLREVEEAQAELRLERAARQLHESGNARLAAKQERARQTESLNVAAQNRITGSELSWLQSCLAAVEGDIEQFERAA